MIFLTLPSEGVMSHLFIPFIDFGVMHPFQNPWSQMPAENFPYGIVLYVFLFIPKFIFYFLFGESSLGTESLSFLAMKTPLLCFDLLLLQLLVKITNHRENHILWFYWLNPITIYITYVHGQLDIIPMFFALSGIFYAGTHQLHKSSLFTSFAVLSKFHVILIIPLILSYYWNNEFISVAIKKIKVWLLFFTLTVVIGIFPIYLGQKLEYNSLGSPEAFRIFSLNYQFDQNRTIYIGIMVVLFVLGRLILSTKMSAEGLLLGSGILFGSLLVVTHSMPGWYFWILPFITIFFSVYNFAPRILLLFMILFYFLSISPILTLLPLSFEMLNLFTNISFSLLQLTIVTILVFIFIMALQKQAPFSRRLKPVAIGIAGNSGVGKNLLTNSLVSLFGKSTTQILEGDDYHKWERGNIKWQDYTHLHPRANHLFHLKDHINQLIHGKLIFQRHYDHSTGKFTEPRPFQPTKTLVVQGLHTLYLRSLRDEFDLKIYISSNEKLRTLWKIKRDCKERGQPLEKVLSSIKSREKDTENYVEPQREVADLIIEYIPNSDLDLDLNLNLEELKHITVNNYRMKLIIWNDLFLEDLLEKLSSVKSLQVILIDDKDINRLSVNFDGKIKSEEIKEIANATIFNQRSITSSRAEPVWEKDYLGLIQLFIFKLLSERF